MSYSWHRDRGAAGVFGIMLGLFLGLLIAAIVMPRRQPEREVSESGDRSVVAGDLGGTGEGAGPSVATQDGAGGNGNALTTGTGTGSGAATSGGTSSAGVAGAGAGAAVRGVTDDKIRVGVTYPDISVLRALGPSYDNGDVPKQWEALVDGWRRSRVLPVHGRDIELVFADYNVLQPEEQRSACVAVVQDGRAFMVIAQTYYLIGAECVAREFRTPLITSDGPNDPIFQRSHPMLFSLQMSEDRVLRNLIHWADSKGFLDGKQVGIYYEDRPDVRDQMSRTVKAELARLGHDLTAEATTTQTLGGPRDAVAVQQFQANGVDVALLFTSKGGFMQQAQAQRYKPVYLESDHLFGTSDTTTSTYPVEQFDGTLGFTGRRVGETSAGMALDAEGRACVANYERFANEKLQQETTEWAYVLTVCDLGKALMCALTAAGRELSHGGVVAGLETMRNVGMNRYAPVTFTPQKHHGVDSYRELRWHGACKCWRVAGPFRPLLVP